MSHTSLRRIVALNGVVAATAIAAMAVHHADAAVDIELSRSEIIEPASTDDVLAASASVLAWPTIPSTSTPPPTAPPTTVPPAPEQAPAPPPPAPTTSAPAPAPAPTTTSSTRNSGCESSMMQWINEVRSAHGIAPVTTDDHIHPIALHWTDAMAQRQDLAHNPDHAHQIFDARPEAMRVAENVGRGTGTDRDLFDAFMASSGHRSKILGGEYSHATVACTVDAGGQTWTTMNFWG